tara:strand:- start:343 stop:1842 length:1500 start_codon:yes stop_codon:yes gene_type:complete
MRLSVLFLLCASAVQAEPLFTPVTVPHHQYDGGWEHFVGGGLTAFDCNGDGRTDLAAAGGSNPAAVFVNESNDAIRLRMEPLAASDTTGLYALDINNDSHLDLVMLRVGPDQIWLGDGACGFAPTDMIDFPDKWTTAFSATWEQGQDRPTLAMGHYVDRSNPDGPFQACDTNSLWRPEGDGWEQTMLAPGFCPLSALFTDWSRSGQADLRLSNDRHYYVTGGAEQLWQMAPVPRLYNEADGWGEHHIWGMGIATRDLDRDGRDEVFLSSMGDQRLQRPTGDGPGYLDVPFDVGSTAHRPYTGGDGRPSTGWHIAFGDVQNDGRDDAFIAKGNVQQMPGMAMDDPNNLLIAQPDGTFTEAGLSAGVASLHRGRGAALVDLDNDGLLDLAVVNRRAPMEVWHNTSTDTGNWLSLDLSQPDTNTRAIGAWIEVDDGTSVQSRELVVGGGHAGGSDAPQHFGLGGATSVQVRVLWPNAPASGWTTVQTNQRYRLRPGAAPEAY